MIENSQGTEKASKKVVIAVIAVVLIIALIAGGIFFFRWKEKQSTKNTEEKLTEILEAATTKPIVEMICDDYDKNGTYEAYAIVGQTGDNQDETEHPEFYNADIYFVSEKEAQLVKENVSGKTNGIIKENKAIFISIEIYTSNTNEGKSFIYTVKGEISIESDFSGKYSEVHQYNEKVLAKDDNGDFIEIELTVKEVDKVTENDKITTEKETEKEKTTSKNESSSDNNDDQTSSTNNFIPIKCIYKNTTDGTSETINFVWSENSVTAKAKTFEFNNNGQLLEYTNSNARGPSMSGNISFTYSDNKLASIIKGNSIYQFNYENDNISSFKDVDTEGYIGFSANFIYDTNNKLYGIETFDEGEYDGEAKITYNSNSVVINYLEGTPDSYCETIYYNNGKITKLITESKDEIIFEYDENNNLKTMKTSDGEIIEIIWGEGTKKQSLFAKSNLHSFVQIEGNYQYDHYDFPYYLNNNEIINYLFCF
ncbi:MAG: hypothetical protein E7536_04765 [Ruminococcaceae bacterium]|nr:hypothetical protein [Oscillospiraceae bacterium]